MCSIKSKAYSKDIRWKMIHHIGVSLCVILYKTIAENLNMNPSTVCRTVRLFRKLVQLKHSRVPQKYYYKRLSARDKIVLLEAVLETPNDLRLTVRT